MPTRPVACTDCRPRLLQLTTYHLLSPPPTYNLPLTIALTLQFILASTVYFITLILTLTTDPDPNPNPNPNPNPDPDPDPNPNPNPNPNQFILATTLYFMAFTCFRLIAVMPRVRATRYLVITPTLTASASSPSCHGYVSNS
eukprot:scaffold5903_cov37-Phaeocystis_antarctica.AAC.1